MLVDQAVGTLWPGREVSVEPLGGGITNHNFKVTVDDEVLVLRIGGKDTALLGIDRVHEHEAALVAAGLRIGPEVVRFADGCLVTRFIEGEVGQAKPADVGALLRRLHSGPRISSRFDPFRVVAVYAETAAARGVPLPAAYDDAAEVARRIKLARGNPQLVPCHNDLLAANFIHDGDRVWIVDWEYSGMGDPYFDLGNFAVNNELDEAGERELLDAYGEDDRRALALMRFMSDLREAMWGVVQQGISELDFDFAGYAETHFERLERTADDTRFRKALTA
jgi:thiamine kinase-like enzyme